MDRMSEAELNARIKTFITKKHQQFPRLGLIRKEKQPRHFAEYLRTYFMSTSTR